MPYKIPDCEGSRYRPSNGTEGMMFQEQWCARCRHDGYTDATPHLGCALIAKAMAYDVDDPEYPREWIHDGAGRPTCTKFSEGDPGSPEPEPPPDQVLRFMGEPDLFTAPEPEEMPQPLPAPYLPGAA